MKNIKSFVAGMATTAIIASLSLGAVAAVREQLIKAEFSNIKIVIDGATIVPKDATGKTVEPFIYDGSTYLPVRAIGNALGKEVGWDEATKTATLTSKQSELTYSRSNPAPIGKTQSVNYSTYNDSYTAAVTVSEIIRGDAAKTMLTAADKLVANPPEGMEYLLARVSANVSNVKNDKVVELGAASLKAYTSESVEYAAISDTHITPEFQGKVYSGGTVNGYAIFMVNKKDLAPKMVFGAAADGTSGIWFKLSK